MYIDEQNFTTEHTILDSDSLASYQIQYSNGSDKDIYVYSRYAHLVMKERLDSSHFSNIKTKFRDCFPSYPDTVFDAINSIASVTPADAKFDYSPPSFIKARFSLNSSVSTQDFQKSYANSIKSFCPSSTYPIATRYISSDGAMFIERPPFQATVDYKPSGASSKKKKLDPKTIWIPWTMYVFNPNYPGGYQYMYFSHKSLTSMSDNYYPTYLPNTYQDARICYSNSLSSLPISGQTTPASMYSYMINEFFAGSWNADLVNPWAYMYNSIIYYYLNTSKNKDEILSTIPHLRKLFSPDPETIEKAGLHKVNKIYYYYTHNSPEKFFANMTHEYSHYAILSIISTFSLQEVLALLEEIDMIQTDLTLNDNQSIYYIPNSNHGSFKGQSFKKISTKPDYYSQTLNSSTIRASINKVCADNSLFPEYQSFDKDFLFVNFPVSNTSISHLSVLLRYQNATKLNQAASSSSSSTISVYNHFDNQIHYLTPSVGISTEQLYLEMLKVYVDNNRYFPCSSTPFYEISSKDEYAKL